MTKLMGCVVAVMAACGGPKTPAATTATSPPPPTSAAATAPTSAGCPSVTFSCAYKEKYGDEQLCIEGGDDLAKPLREKCTPDDDGQPSAGPCVRTGAVGGCTTPPGTMRGVDACMTTWVTRTSTVKTAEDLRTQCEQAKGTFVAN